MNDHIVLSIYEGHMASSCLMINGKVISAAHEERFSRIKCDVGFPFQAINYCIKYAGIEYSQIDKVVLSNLDFNKNGIANLMFKRPALYSIDDWIYENNNYWRETLINKKNIETYYEIMGGKKRVKDHSRMYKEFSKLVMALSKETNLPIIIRPHPMDKLKHYDFLSNYKNVKVINEGSISEWIHYAKIVVHSGCTGGLEASVRGRPTISYLPFNSVHGHPLCDKFSIKTKNLKQCLNAIKKVAKNKTRIKKPDLNSFKLRAYNLFSNKPGYKVIADEFVKLTKTKEIQNQNNDLILKFKFKARDIRSKFLKLKYGNFKFSIFNKNDTLNTFKILKKLNPEFKNLKLNFIKKDIIQIKKISN